MKWVNANDITNWLSLNPGILPELLRRLILATAGSGNIEEIHFPSGNSISTSGWDGHLVTQLQSSPYFPGGTSAWELSVEKSASSKAEKDYIKRTSDPNGMILLETTYVTVTTRSWPTRSKWQSDKRKESKWKNVRVINADDIETWLEGAPVVALWLARQIGKLTQNGMRDLEFVFEEWTAGTKPLLTPEIIIAGRKKIAERIQLWLSQNPSILHVRGDHPDESFAFLYAAIAQLPESDKLEALSRCLVVDNINELRECIRMFPSPLIICIPGECIPAAALAVSKGHHIFVAVDAKDIAIRDVVRLPRPMRSIVEKELQNNGVSQSEAKKLSRDFGRSIPVLRRHLSTTGSVNTPSWSSVENSNTLIPALLAGSWDGDKNGDKEILEILSMKPYDTYIQDLRPFLDIDDAPINRVGNVWSLKSPIDVWFLVSKHLEESHLKLLNKTLLSVLTKTDPKYDLDEDQRWAAAIYGKSNPYSVWIRTGLVESLVLLAIYGNRSSNIHSTQPFVDNAVHSIFTNLNTWEAWASLKDETPLLSEAAPDVFMDVVNQRIQNSPDIFVELLKGDAALFSECKHSGVLWAIESIAWSNTFFMRAVNMLFELSIIDPGGRWANRPLSSLKDIFVPQFPQTNASPSVRIEALNLLAKKDAAIVWSFVKGYFTEGGVLTESHKFQWRDDGGERGGFENESFNNHQEYLKGLIVVAKDLACRKENIISSMEDFNQFPVEIQDLLIGKLNKYNAESFQTNENERFLSNLRHTLNWINSYGRPPLKDKLPKLQAILERFAPKKVIERVGWLLSNPWPDLPEGDRKDYEIQEELVKKRQEEAAREILDHTSIEELLSFAKSIPYPGVLGINLGKVIKSDLEDNAILDSFIKKADDNKILIRAYSESRVTLRGTEWINKQIIRLKTKKTYTPKIHALLLFGLPEGEETWEIARAQGEDVEEEYWKETSGRSIGKSPTEVEFAVNKLINVNRAADALVIAGGQKVSIPSVLLQKLINKLLEGNNFIMTSMDDFYISNIFKQIYDRNELSLEDIAKLEWPFAKMFDEIMANTNSDLAIHRILQKDPSFFIELVSFIYKRDDKSPDPNFKSLNDKTLDNRARGAIEVLKSWYLIPGLNKEGSINEEFLKDWIVKSRKKAIEAKRVIGVELEIARILSRSPNDPDGLWPHFAIRNIIEFLNSESIDRHIIIDIRNSRGIVTREMGEGGRQERELAKKYNEMSEKLNIKWPRTAKLLRSLAESYESEAKREDLSTELQKLKWD